MRRKILIAMIFAFCVGVATFFLTAPGQHAQAQQNCPDFRAIAQAKLPVDTPLRPEDEGSWGGNVYGYLGQEMLVGIFSGNDGNVSWQGWVGMGKGGTYKFAFGPLADNNTFTVVATQATFPNPPGKFPVGGVYQAAWKITEGTGRFQDASGNLFAKGPYLAWDLDKPQVLGRFNAEISGNICGAQ